MVIIVLFMIITITATITTAVREAAMIIVQDAVRFGVSGDGYLRVLSPRRCTERVPSSEGRNCTRRLLASVRGLLWTWGRRCRGCEGE